MTIMGIVGMVGAVAASGIQSGEQSANIRKNIGDVEESTRKWKDMYAKLDTGIEDASGQLQNACTDLQQEYGAIMTKLDVNREAHSESLKKTQMYGVIFISVIFFALLLKQFKLLGPLIELLMIPEKFVWNYLVPW